MGIDLTGVKSGGYEWVGGKDFFDGAGIQKLTRKAQKINEKMAMSPNNMLFRAMRAGSSSPKEKLERLYQKHKLLNVRMVDILTQSFKKDPLKILSCARILGLRKEAGEAEIVCQVVKHLAQQQSPHIPRLLNVIRGRQEGPAIEFVSTPLLTQQYKNAIRKITENSFSLVDEAVERKDLSSACKMMDEMIATMQEEFEFLRDEPLSEKKWEKVWAHLHLRVCLCKSYWDEKGMGVLPYSAFARVNDLLHSLNELQYERKSKGEKSPGYSKLINELKNAIDDDRKDASKLLKEFCGRLRGDFSILNQRLEGDLSSDGVVYFKYLLQKAGSCLDLLTSSVKERFKDDADFQFYAESLENFMPIIQNAIDLKVLIESEKPRL